MNWSWLQEKDQGLGDCDDEDRISFHEESSGGLENVSHKDKWVDELKFTFPIIDTHCCRQDVESNGMGLGGSKCSGLCSIARHIFLEKHVRDEKQECVEGRGEGPTNSTSWTHKCEHHNRGVVWDTAVSRWAGVKEWVERTKRQKNVEAGRISKHTFWRM